MLEKQPVAFPSVHVGVGKAQRASGYMSTTVLSEAPPCLNGETGK